MGVATWRAGGLQPTVKDQDTLIELIIILFSKKKEVNKQVH